MVDTVSPAQPPLSKSAVFLRRLGSTVVLWTVVLWTLFAGHTIMADSVFLVIMLSLAGSGLAEFYGLVAKRGLVCFPRLGIGGGLLLMSATFWYLSGTSGQERLPSKANDFEASFLIVFVLGLCIRQLFARTGTAGMLAISTTLFGLMYVPWLLNFVQKISFFPKVRGTAVEGTYYVLYFILVTKLSDVGAYLTGSLIGRHKMIPRISPGKTWEGFAGAILFSTAASLAFAHLAGAHLYGMTLTHAGILGLLLGATAVVGDLIESLLKREAGVKDSGRLFPGIGGILDLLDSLLFNAPLMYLYLRHVLTR
jgi:phosphatidate cytidylyltransferase